METALQNDSLNTFVETLKAVGLTSVLRGEGPFTVFAPTDSAFAAALADGRPVSFSDPEHRERALTMLMYHIIRGRLTAAEFGAMDTAKTLQGNPIQFRVENGILNLKGANKAQVVNTNIEASNGVIHVIDNILFPPYPISIPTTPGYAWDKWMNTPSYSEKLQRRLPFFDSPVESVQSGPIAILFKDNFSIAASLLVESISLLKRTRDGFTAVPADHLSQDRKEKLAKRLISETTRPTLDPGDILFGVSWTLAGGETFKTFGVGSRIGSEIKFEPLLWLSTAVVRDRPAVEREVFWKGQVENLLGIEVVKWEFRTEFVSDDGCEVSGASVEKTVSAPAWGWSARGVANHSKFCVEKKGCTCRNGGPTQSDQMECVKAKAEIGFGSVSPNISISAKEAGVSVGGMTVADGERSETARVCANGQFLGDGQ